MPKDALIQGLIDEGYLKNPRIIDAFRRIDRADFVLPEFRKEAYTNHPLPIGENQTISQPLTVAFMLELLDPKPGERILDAGAGSGWTSALLAEIVSGGSPDAATRESRADGKVFAVERIPEVCEFGEKNIRKYGFIEKGVVEWTCADATAGLPEKAPYDKILAGAAAPKEIPDAWRTQLKIRGKIVAPVGNSIRLFIKKSETEWEEKEFPGFAFVPLVKNIPRKKKNAPREHADERTKERKTGAARTIAVIFFLALSLFAYEIYVPHASFQGTKQIEIEKGMGSRMIGELLKKEGVIRSKWAFVTYVSFLGKASRLKPGIYIFDRALDYQTGLPELTRILVRGGPREHIVTIPEGWDIQDIAELFEERRLFSREEFFASVSPDAAENLKNRSSFPVLSDIPRNRGLEGYLFPDTYRVFTDAKPEDVVAKTLVNFEAKLTENLRLEIARQKKTIFEIVTMASLIEKEVVSDEDRALVSGILWKRTDLGIPLQVDATIVYIKKHNAGGNGRAHTNEKVSTEDITIDSPYNTYLSKGFPKGPIANPGLSAIRAAIYPKKSPYLYYLSAPEGRTIFSRTLEEHNAAKTKYLGKNT